MARNTIGTAAYVPALVMEFVVTFLFNFAGVGAAMAAEKLNGDPLVGLFFVAMAHGLAVAVLMSAGFPISGGHLNPAVTFGLLADGHINWTRTLLYWVDQCLASALLTYLTGGLTPPVHSLGSGVGAMQGVIMEFVLTFSLLFTVFATLVDSEGAMWKAWVHS